MLVDLQRKPARVMVLGSLPLASAPRAFASRVSSYVPHASLERADLQGLIASWAALQWSLRWIVDAVYLFPVPLLRQELHRGLEALDIQAQGSVQFAELPVRMFPNQAIIADHLADNRSVFLRNKALIIFQMGASPRERQVFFLTRSDQRLIDDFPTVIGINPQNGKGKERACALEVRWRAASSSWVQSRRTSPSPKE